jgi:hypothetical protein
MTEVNDSIDTEDRIDESGIEGFAAMGYTKRLSPNMVIAYKAFKIMKDKNHPGRLTPEALATVAMMGEIADGNINFVSEEEDPIIKE